MSRIALILSACLVPAALPVRADDGPTHYVAPASDEAARAIARFRAPEGLKVELFAAEPMLANPVAFAIDERNRFYVAETFRHSDGVTDNRSHMQWLVDELAARTVADRIEVYRRYLGDDLASFRRLSERVRMVVDADGDGVADRATVFAEGFDDIPDGIGAGLLARDGNVYYACIPKLWKLNDTDGDGVADVREAPHDGYGVHTSFIGHDLHGLIFGPDGKLYFTIGDRGLNVTTADGRNVALPDTGAVLRCEPDGSELELFAVGLRNPQELAFDRYGNLFTGDNNSDSGDRARWVYLMEGGDSGWHIGFQYIEKPVSRGPWNSEKLWYPHFEGQAAYIVPPVANLGDGPSGLAYDPGTGLPETYRGKFFLCDFRGTSGQSGIRSFGVRPRGAGFEVVDQEQFLWSILATDCDFGTDGALYVSDWVEGWAKPGKGRLYRVLDPEHYGGEAAKRVQGLLAEGAKGRTAAELVELLRHDDMRVRQMAQFGLASRGDAEAIRALAGVAAADDHQLARLHATWGLGQIGRKDPEALRPVLPLLGDADPEVRCQAARVLGEGRAAAAFDPLVGLLRDDSARVRSFAAMALAKLGRAEAVAPVLALLRENADADPYLRHAGVMALAASAGPEALAGAAADPAPAVRMGALLAMRRRLDPALAGFLADPKPLLVAEAARAIHDLPLDAAMPRLAALPASADLPEPILRRVVNANLRVGGPENARALAAMAAADGLPEPIRVEALEALAAWPEPPALDRVVGLHRPIPSRPAALAFQALDPVVESALFGGPGLPVAVRDAAIRAALTLGLAAGEVFEPRRELTAAALARLVRSDETPASTRIEALRGLDATGDARIGEAARAAAESDSAELRREALRVVGKLDPAEAVVLLGRVLGGGSAGLAERQGALATLSGLRHPGADELLSALLDDLLAGRVEAGLQLDVLEAARLREDGDVRAKLERFEAARPADDPLAAHAETLAGGDRRRGRQIFRENIAVACLRCHKAEGRGGEVGPDLDGIAARVDRRHLLEAIVAPNAKIAEGFDTLVVATDDGQVHTGILKAEDGEVLRLITAEGEIRELRKDAIEERRRGESAMPADIVTKLSKAELRDLVEYLSTLRRARPKEEDPL